LEGKIQASKVESEGLPEPWGNEREGKGELKKRSRRRGGRMAGDALGGEGFSTVSDASTRVRTVPDKGKK